MHHNSEHFCAPLPFYSVLLTYNSISDKFAIICLIKHGEHVAEQATKTNPPQLHICMFFIN